MVISPLARLILALLALGFLALFLVLLPPAAAENDDDDKETLVALRAEADRILKLKKSKALDRIGIVVICAEHHRQNGDTKTATPYLNKVLKLDPWCMDAHLMLAEMQKVEGNKAAAEKKAEWILKHAVSDQTRGGALHLLDRPADSSLPAISKIPGESTKIAVVPIGPVDVLLLKAAADLVMRHINYPVIIQQAGLDLPPEGDNPLLTWTEELRKAFAKVLPTEEGQAAIAAVAKSRGDLRSDWTFLQVYRTWLEQTARWRDLSDFDARFNNARERPVWQATNVNRHLAAAIGPFGRSNVMYIGVTQADMLGYGRRGGERPAFGWGGKGLGSVSYGRFIASRTGEKPSWDRMVLRVAKQIICVVGSTFEVRRCTDRKCPMRVVVDIRKLDAKSLDPCKRCATQIRDHY